MMRIIFSHFRCRLSAYNLTIYLLANTTAELSKESFSIKTDDSCCPHLLFRFVDLGEEVAIGDPG